MKTHVIRVLLGLMFAAATSGVLAEATATPSPTRSPGTAMRKLEISNKPWTGDFDRILERRMLRIAVPYSRSLYFNDRGRERGLSAELARDFERWINKKHARTLGKRPLTVYLYPASRDRLLPEVAEGLADIAIGNLTVTEDRLKLVDFVAPDDQARIDEILVTGPGATEVATAEDLAGQVVHVRAASSYHGSLQALNDRLRAAGRPVVKLVLVPEGLEDEDMLEMMNAGLIGLMVVDDWKARMWAQVLPKVRVRADIVLRDDGKTGWAIRKGSAGLAAEIEHFYVGWIKSQGIAKGRLATHMKRVKALKDPTRSREWKRFSDTLELFRRYGDRYGFDPLMLAAQGYQESQLDQSARSHVGAIGVMQVMPATGADMRVGDIHVIEPNIHAGTKYMDLLMTKFFADAKFSEANRPLFAFASYNAGPGNISKCRREAAKRGLDPDKWFNNVEIVVAEKIGIETTTYVRNIYKYYAAYRLTLEAQERAEEARQQVAPR